MITTDGVIDQSPDLGIYWHEMTRFLSEQKACHFVSSQQIVFYISITSSRYWLTRNDTIFFSNKKRVLFWYFLPLLVDFAPVWVNFWASWRRFWAFRNQISASRSSYIAFCNLFWVSKVSCGTSFHINEHLHLVYWHITLYVGMTENDSLSLLKIIVSFRINKYLHLVIDQ